MLSEILEKHVFQNYKHYKLPVTMNPLDYGKLIKYYKADNSYNVLITPFTQALIYANEAGTDNRVKILNNGDIILEYKDKSYPILNLLSE